MPIPTDDQLLKRFYDAHCDEAFRQLVARHLDLVHSVATRIIRNPNDARDVAQEVFSRLARTEGRIPKAVPLPVWLHRITRSSSANFVRGEERRRRRQAAADSLHAMKEESSWQDLDPIIDTLIDRLSQKDRAALVLRYYSGKTHAEIGEELQISEEAARKRVARSLEKLRQFLSRRGVTTTAAFLATVLPAHAATPSPAGLAGSISTSALAATNATLTTSATLTTALTMTTTTKTCIAGAFAITLTGVATYVATTTSGDDDLRNGSATTAPAGDGPGTDAPRNPTLTGGPGSERTRNPAAKSTGPPSGIDEGTWQQAGAFLSMMDMIKPGNIIPPGIAPGEKMLETMKERTGFDDETMEELSGIVSRFRKGKEDTIAGSLAKLSASKELIRESIALDMLEDKGGLTEDQTARSKELGGQMEAMFAEGEAMMKNSKRWYKNEELLASMGAVLTEEESQAFDTFVEERRSIGREGWAFNRSQRLAKELHLKPEQRQAVFEELVAREEDPESLANLLDDGQRKSYLENWTPQKESTIGISFGIFNMGKLEE